MAYVPSVSTNNGMGCISTDGNSKCLFGENGIQISGNLLTTPIVATISQSGISTTNTNGFDFISPLNMNSNNINNVNQITSTTFVGSLTGTSTNSSAINTTSDNTSGTYYIPFTKTSAGSAKTLYVDDTTGPLSYNPSTSTLTTSIFSGLCDTGGLVYLSTGSQSITGSATFTNINLASIFNSTYKNYRIVLAPTTQLSISAYPTYSLTAFLGTGTLPTTASLYGFEMTSSNVSVVSPIYTGSSTIGSAPLVLAVSQSINHQTIIEVENVGFTATSTQLIGLKCKSFYSNPGISGASDRSILASIYTGAITGLTLQQSSIGVGNNTTIGWTIYAYK
jgi:hypothetical protein